ncbi:MAG: single-stranded-DNA-specific exonuclease RecJ [Gammaproteobacteria bacterium]
MSRLAAPADVRCRTATPAITAALPASLHPVVRRVLAAREVSPQQLKPGLAHLLPVGELPGVEAVAARLTEARISGERVLVIGDFDADGATATALALTCLRAFGFQQPDFLVPDRFHLGYGLSPAIAELAASRPADQRPQLLLTVDNGITSVDGVRRARELGMEVLITDHHLVGDALPDGALIVNPNLPGSTFGSPALCGVGVAFYVFAAVGRHLAELDLISKDQARETVTDCLDLVALGTVADLVPLDYNNRILVGEGLRRVRAGRARPGIEALFRIAGRDPAQARSADLGFAIAPRLNAAGRLTDMSLGINCLLAPDEAAARQLALQLDALNTERRALQARMQAEASELLAELPAADNASAICLFDERWHEGIVGLVASRLRENTGLPAIAFARATEPGWLRGSARSVPGLHVRDAIAAALITLPAEIAARVRFGGHAMAAGLSMPEVDMPAFRDALDVAVATASGGLQSGPAIVWTDGPLESADLQLQMAETLADHGPWGQGFPEPLFDNEFVIREQRVVGEGHLQLKVQLAAGEPLLAGIAFNCPALPGAPPHRARLVYRLDVNHFRNNRSAQLVVEHLEYV